METVVETLYTQTIVLETYDIDLVMCQDDDEKDLLQSVMMLSGAVDDDGVWALAVNPFIAEGGGFIGQ